MALTDSCPFACLPLIGMATSWVLGLAVLSLLWFIFPPLLPNKTQCTENPWPCFLGTRIEFSQGLWVCQASSPLLGAFHTLVKTSCSLHAHSHFTFSFVCSSESKTSSTWIHPYVGNCAARTSIHIQYPWLLCTNSFHAHPWALACLSPLSICLDSNVPACGWLDPWHRIEFPNNARGLHGQAAQHSQRHLSCEEGLLSESQGDI